jgi:pimeloyl-ACP methyl ester carboxylesterase
VLKWIKRIFLSLFALVGVAVITGIVFEQWSRWSVAREYQPNGQLYEVDGRAMHLHCTGAGEPTVVLQSGFGFDGSLSWVLVQPEIARTNRVCSYDRAGLLWSDGSEEAPTAKLIAERLHTLLGIASERPPYVLVGHSLGGPLTMVFADLYRQEAKGVVLVDSSHPEQMKRFSPEAVEAMGGLPSPIVANTMAATGLLRLLESGPIDGFPDETQVALKYLPQSVPGLLAESAAFETIFGEAHGTASFGDLPLVVLTAGKEPDELPSGMTPEIAADISRVWSELQIELTALSTNGDQRVIEDAEHYIQHDNPDAVIRAIRDVVTSIGISATGGQE